MPDHPLGEPAAERSPAERSLAGRLLVASPDLLDPHFHRTVVFVLAHGDDGTLGLILNRPLPDTVEEHLPGWGAHVSEPRRLFEGGPVEQSAVLTLGRALPNGRPAWVLTATERIGLIDQAGAPDNLATGLEAVRVFGGHAGWGGGQLEAEIEERAWFVVDAEPGDPFAEQPEQLWQTVLRRQQSKLAMYAFLPDDPSVN